MKKNYFKNFLIVIYTTCLISGNFAYANEYPNTSIGVLDLNLVLTDAKAAVKAAEQIDEFAKDIESEIKASDENMVSEQNKLIEAQSIMAPEAFEKKRIEYEKNIQNYNISRQEKLFSIDKLIEKSRNDILDELKPILEEISEEKGITILLEKGTVLLNADTMDITNEVVKRLNKALPEINVSLE